MPSTKQMKQQEDDYRAEDDHRTLTRAAEIQEDTTRMAGVRKHHRKMARALRGLDRVVGMSRGKRGTRR